MRFVAILNAGGGTLRTMDVPAFADRLRDTLEHGGHSVELDIVEGDGLMEALHGSVARADVDVVLVGGGDGTISAAAGVIADTDKVLAVLPAGTMNLFARSLGIPLDLDAVIERFVDGRVKRVDVASVNGRIFIHQYSVGLHAKMVALRDQMNFASRLGKILASVRAAIATLISPPMMTVSIAMDGTEVIARTSAIGVTNNLFGEGHLPYADHPDGGTLGIYVTTARDRGRLMRFLAKMMMGRWRRNSEVEIHETGEVTLNFQRVRSRHRAVIDGELIPLERTAVVRIHRGALKVLVPQDQV